jgi:hypothetical protein
VTEHFAHDPWNRTAETVAMHSGGVPTEGHVIEFGGTQPMSGPPAPGRKRRRGVFIAASTAAVVLIGAGAYAGVRAWTGSGNAEPETVMPATATAFARIDLNPGVRDKLAFDNLVKKFPTNGRSTTDVLTQIETDAAKAAGLDYTTDVKPWFDGRVGVGAWADAKGNPVGLITLASKDDAKAKVALAKVQSAKGGADKFGFVLKGGYALIALGDADAQADATAAANEAAAHNLADDSAFKESTGKTGDHNLLLAYVDLHGVGQLMSKALGNGALGAFGPRFGAPPGLRGGATDQLDKLTGTFAIGGRITDDGIEIQGHAQGLEAKNTIGRTNVRPALDAMPAGSVVALATAGIDPASDAAKQFGPMLDKLLSGAGGLLGGGVPSLGGGVPSLGGGTPNPQLTAMLGQLSPVLQKIFTAKVISFALTAVKPTPAMALNVQAQSAADAAAIVGPIQQLLGPAAGVLSLKQDGDTVRAAFGPAGTGRLSSSPVYRTAMAGMDNAQFAAFVDLQALRTQGGPQGVDAVKGLGVSVRVGDTTADFLTRVVITK